MYGWIKGEIIYINNYIIIKNNNMGYKIFVGEYFLQKLQLNQETILWLSQIVRENEISLYGFIDESNMIFFESLISVSGVGPKVALALLDTLTAVGAKQAIIQENEKELTKTSGVGPKLAKKIILELKNKAEKIEIKDYKEISDENIHIVETLEALGFPTQDIRKIIPELKSTTENEKIKEAIKKISSKII